MANHQSLMDIPVLAVALPIDFRMIFKKQLLGIPFFGQIIYLVGFIPIDRTNRARAI